MYSYGGYNQVCSIGEEIRSPTRTVPRAIVLAMLVVAVVYIVMSTVIVGMIPWQEVARTNTIAFPGPREGVLFSICYLAASVIAYLVFVRSSRSM